MSEYAVGNRVRCSGTFKDNTGALVDPTTVSFDLKNPANYVTTYVYGTAPELVNDSPGKYHVDVDVDTHGVWFYRFYSTGIGKAADEANFTVEDSEFS